MRDGRAGSKLLCDMQEGAKGSKKLPECVLEVPSLHEVELSHGKQVLPDFTRPGSAAGEPIMKERALLQVRAAFPVNATFAKARIVLR